MNFLVTYDVSTSTRDGQRRLRRVAKICEGFGQRVQYSVFEVVCSRTDLARLLSQLEAAIDPSEDSLRFYPIHSDAVEHVIQVGVKRELPQDQAWTL